MKLDLKTFRELSVRRAKESFKTYDNVPVTFFTTALAGELGELCNLIKKLERAKAGGLDAGTNHKAKDISNALLAEEIGGTFIYLDLLASLLNIDLEEAVIKTFNDKSEENNLPFIYNLLSKGDIDSYISFLSENVREFSSVGLITISQRDEIINYISNYISKKI